jgi:flagellar M-ring protein FliF
MSNAAVTLWGGAGRGLRTVLIGMGVLLVSLLIWLIFKALHDEYGVLFGDLAEQDAAAIVEQLKQRKVPYRLGTNGTSISVPADQVHDVRLQLMSSDLPLSGGVGFEIFDKQGLGTTEHSQRVSYQRALQGELARTIGTLDHVKHVRVHLVLPETSLFNRDHQHATAAVNLTMSPGTSLQREQIAGIQRLVAAAAPGLESSRVVVTDQRGITLSAADPSSSAGGADARLQVKREIEEYMTLKIARLLDSAFGAGQAIVSVDATLNFDATKTTIQDLLPAAAANGEGRLVRRRQMVGPSGGEGVMTAATDGAMQTRQAGSSMEVEYEFGKRIDEVIAAPGAVTRVSVGVIVPGEVSEEKRARIVELVRMAAGLDDARGDAVSVQPLGQLASYEQASEPAEAVESVAPAQPEQTQVAVPESQTWSATQIMIALAVVVVLTVLVVLFARRGRGRLTERERQELLDDIRSALNEDLRVAAARGKP